jgi:hypothetical protein
MRRSEPPVRSLLATLVRENPRRYTQGQRTLNAVDMERGY